MKIRINKTLLIGLLTILQAVSCSTNQKFDSDKWQQKGVDWWMMDVREKMIDDLIQSDTLIGLTKNEIVELLGEPEVEREAEFEYLIREKYGTDIDPEYISNLRIAFDKDGYVASCEIENYR